MQSALNLYFLTRCQKKDDISLYEFSLSHRKDKLAIKEAEWDSLTTVVEKIFAMTHDVNIFNGFFYSYSIPKIANEFDLLKITGDTVFNLELKSQFIPEEDIKSQLVKNKYYLSFLERSCILFSYVCELDTLFMLDEDDNLKKITFSNVVNELEKLEQEEYEYNIDPLFNAANYLVSPLNNPIRFSEKEYFLTNQQREVKQKILKQYLAGETGFTRIKGSPGTGKTLLIYDLALEFLQKGAQVLIIHCGMKSTGHNVLDKKYENLHIIAAKDIKNETLKNWPIILVDETQRIYISQLNEIIKSTRENNLFTIFSLDPKQYISKLEDGRAIYEYIDENVGLINDFGLKEKVRTNKEIAGFIKGVLKNSTVEEFDPSYVKVVYANNKKEVQYLITSFEKSGYTFINYTSSNFKSTNYDDFESKYNSHQVIGQEFDKVVTTIGPEFYYDSDNRIKATEHPTKDYLYRQMLYQNITRTRNELALIVWDNYTVFEKIIALFNTKED